MFAVFVYGTLKQGHCRAAFLEGQQFLGAATTLAEYRLFDCGDYPGLVASGEGVEVSGEVWNIDETCLLKLDQVEAVDQGLYQRRLIRLKPPFDDQTVESYFYLHSTESLPDCGNSWTGK